MVTVEKIQTQVKLINLLIISLSCIYGNHITVPIKHFTEHNLWCRTKEIYETHCTSLGGPLNDHIAMKFGVVRNSMELNLE